MKENIPVGTFKGGRIIKSLKPDRYGHRRVRFVCSSCRRRGECRLSDLKRGQQTSCGCLKRIAFLRLLKEKAEAVPESVRNQIWTEGELRGLEALVKSFGSVVAESSGGRLRPSHRRALLNFIWRTEGARVLQAIPTSRRELLNSAIRRRGVNRAAAEQGISVALALRILRSMAPLRRLPKKLRMRLSQAIALADEGISLLAEAKDARYAGKWSRPPNELNRLEFTGRAKARRGSIRAAYEVLSAFPAEHVPVVSRGMVSRFLHICRKTLEGRKARYLRFIRERESRVMDELLPA